MALVPVTYITLDGNKYAVQNGSYVRSWTRQFNMTISAATVRLNFTDKGPGIRVYSMTLYLAPWSSTSLPYKEGITQSVATQASNLETSYGKISTALTFTDPFGNSPDSGKVYFTKLTQRIPAYSTIQTPFIEYDVEFTEASSEVG